MSARFLARSIILSRSPVSAFLLSLSRSAGIDANADSIAMSFASAKLTFINCNSCSILSNVRLDKSFSESVSGHNYRGSALRKQRHSRRMTVAALTCPAAYFCFGSLAALQSNISRMSALRGKAVIQSIRTDRQLTANSGHPRLLLWGSPTIIDRRTRKETPERTESARPLPDQVDCPTKHLHCLPGQ